MRYRILFLIAGLSLGIALTGCGAAQPTPDAAATEAVIAAKIFATLTASAPTTAPQSTATPVPPTMPPPTLTLVPSPTAIPPTLTLTALPLPTSTFTPPPSPRATPEGPIVIVQSANLNVRAGPGTGHAVVATARQSDRLPVTGRNADGSWLEVTLPGGRSGWIAASLVQLNVPADKVAVAQVIPTPPLAPTAAPATVAKPAAGKRDLEVKFINPHYDCELIEWGSDSPIWGYRAFQVDMYIKNNSSEPVEPPWRPKRWIITDGKTDVVNDLMWQWVDGRTGFYNQPVIQPGQSAGWTFLAFPIDRNQWLKAVEFVWNGQVYRQEFGLGEYGNAYNYKDCGDVWMQYTQRPTPTPRP